MDGAYYWRTEGHIYLRYFDTLDGNLSFGSRYGLFSNEEGKMIREIAKGYLASGGNAPPPPALIAAIRVTEHKYGTFNPDSSTNNFRQFEDCEVMRAGAIWTENIDANTATAR